MPSPCFNISPERVRAAKAQLSAHRAAYPEIGVTADDITLALAHDDPNDYFVTCSLYWDCECDAHFHRPADQQYCKDCDSHRADCADSRIHELRGAGILLDYRMPAVLAACSPHNLAAKPPLSSFIY